MNDRTTHRIGAVMWPCHRKCRHLDHRISRQGRVAPPAGSRADRSHVGGWALSPRGKIVDRLLDQRIVLVNGRLGDALAGRTAQRLLLLGCRDPSRAIELHLSCPESELSASLSVAAAVDLAGAPVHSTVSGTLAGPAVAVLCACAEQTAHRHATFVVSLPAASDIEVSGTAIATRAEEHTRMVAQVVERVAAVTGRPSDERAEDLRSGGRVLSAREAENYGLVADVQ